MKKKSDESLLGALARCKQPTNQSFADAWVGLEPTFSNKKAVRKWAKFSAKKGGEDAYFLDAWMLSKLDDVGRSIKKKYRAHRKQDDAACLFADVKLTHDLDPWKDERVNLKFQVDERADDEFEVRFGMDPETFEFSLKPVPLAWFHDPRFVRFLQLFVWDVPESHGLVPSMAHGGGQFSISAKTYLQGSLLADDIATKLNHPELSTFVNDYPNCDDRAFRATNRRRAAFTEILAQYWSGAFHPDAIGTLRVENALLDTGFAPSSAPSPSSMDVARGPKGDARAVFQTNFAFGRAVRLRAQNVHPGYWQAQAADEEGYRPDQIMRYSEGNLNRLQIAGELHVKSGEVLDVRDVREFDAPLELSMLYDEASWEMRGQMSRTSAEDHVESVLLEAHYAQWLLAHPHVAVKASIAQDKILGDAEITLEKRDPKLLGKLRKAARALNLESSRGRIKSDFVEPETLFWAAWRALTPGEQSEIAREAITGFVERVENAAMHDPRARADDPMAAHRHRIHPCLWKALAADPGALDAITQRELAQFDVNRKALLAKRPMWSPTDARAPWK